MTLVGYSLCYFFINFVLIHHHSSVQTLVVQVNLTKITEEMTLVVISSFGLIFLETSIIELHFAGDSFCLSSFELFWQAPKDYSISARVTFQPFKVVDFGAN